jgi:2-polyprenyl-6-hydroxyphenyl methylase/3-demethylubiquinone-9 3-methyltransferase
LDKYKKLPHFNLVNPVNPDWYPNVTFKNQSIEQLDEHEKYDVIFCLNAINHVEDIALAYRKLAQALKPNGIIIVSTDAHRNSFLHKIFKIIPGDVLHPHQYNLKEYEKFLAQNNIKLFPSILIKKEFIFDYYLTYGVAGS